MGGKRPKDMLMDRAEALEERIAHLTRAVEDLSDVVAAQGAEIDRLSRLTRLLAEREAEREAGLEAPLANQKPPHW
jgi:SlyX protein